MLNYCFKGKEVHELPRALDHVLAMAIAVIVIMYGLHLVEALIDFMGYGC